MKKHFTAKEKGTIAIEAIKDIEPLAKIASKHQANPIQVGLWKKKAQTDIHRLFDSENSDAQKIKEQQSVIDELHRLIGVREAELVWLQKKSAP
jgi:hypothetical protein